MTGRTARRLLGALAMALATSALAPRALAQTTEELQAARELFQEAFADEQQQRYPEALEKFQRVAKVKESASVRYRIATVLMAMGRLREARDLFRALAADKSALPPSDQEISDSAAERSAELDRRIPRLALRLEDNPPEDVHVTIDGAPVPVSTTPRPIELDPGEHLVVATGRGSAPSEQKITLADGAGEVPYAVTLEPARSPEQEPPPSERGATLGWAAIGGGGVLFVTGAVLLLAREGAIGDIEGACPGGVCPTSRRTDVESDRSRAELFGPLGGALAVVGLAAAGAGVYLLVRSGGSTATPAPAKAAVSLAPALGGARLALTF